MEELLIKALNDIGHIAYHCSTSEEFKNTLEKKQHTPEELLNGFCNAVLSKKDSERKTSVIINYMERREITLNTDGLSELLQTSVKEKEDIKIVNAILNYSDERGIIL